MGIVHPRYPVAFQFEMGHGGFIEHLHAQPFGGAVIGVHEALAAAAKEGVGAGKG